MRRRSCSHSSSSSACCKRGAPACRPLSRRGYSGTTASLNAENEDAVEKLGWCLRSGDGQATPTIPPQQHASKLCPACRPSVFVWDVCVCTRTATLSLFLAAQYLSHDQVFFFVHVSPGQQWDGPSQRCCCPPCIRVWRGGHIAPMSVCNRHTLSARL